MIAGISKHTWDLIKPQTNPFLRYEFFEALLTSGCVGPEAGWTPVTFLNTGGDAGFYTFSKTHSYGEYIFDWGWAEAYGRHGIAYYPKLTSMIPFTPVTTSHFLMPTFDAAKARELLNQYESFFLKEPFSSSHFLFLGPEEKDFFAAEGYLIRESMQYHFFNEGYLDFPHFLTHLKSRKAKQLRSERLHEGLTITQYTKDELTPEHGERMYQFYLSTIENKNSYDYLNGKFFRKIFQTMKDNILYVEATKDGDAVAGALFFYDEEKLYGRYWGSKAYFEKLHFELCYYQGIDFCLRHKLKVFEAGAQGQHKIARGFRPVKTYSAHKIKHPDFKKAIEDFIESEKLQITLAVEEYSKSLPFKILKDGT